LNLNPFQSRHAGQVLQIVLQRVTFKINIHLDKNSQSIWWLFNPSLGDKLVLQEAHH